MPAGKIESLSFRAARGSVDTHVYEGYTIPSHYDSLIAKLVIRGRSWRLRGDLSALGDGKWGVKTTGACTPSWSPTRCS